MYFDTHCHLNSEQLYENRDEFIKHALDNQVEMMVVVGYDLESSKKAVEIAKEHSFIYAAVGIGPNDCLNTTTQDLQIIDEYLNEPKVVALGEIGLDYYWDDVPSDKQKKFFNNKLILLKNIKNQLLFIAEMLMKILMKCLKEMDIQELCIVIVDRWKWLKDLLI